MSTPRNSLAALCLATLICGVIAPSAEASDQGRYPCEEDLIEVMFSAEARVRLRDGELVDLATTALEGVEQVLESVDTYAWLRICDVREEVLDEIQARGAANSGRAIYNLNNVYRLRFLTEAGGVDIWALSSDLEALPGILLARPVPRPMELPLPPDYEPMQGYLDPASSTPSGIDAEYAWTLAGGDGSGITVVDIEYSWNENHQDLTKAVGSQINSFVQDPFANTDHGTAVIGELISDDNGPNWGTKGICFGSALLTCGSYFGTPAPSWNVAGAIATAIAYLSAGDIVLLEQQWDYTGGGGYVPIEWWYSMSPNPQLPNPVYVAITNAIAVGIHVVEAGGNGGLDTDLMAWWGDSGAIIVGAGGAYAGGTYPGGDLERLAFSSYGSRFDLQGWGEDVVTSGYGDLYNSEGIDLYYTRQFSGTSSASPIVAGAVACCEGYWRANVSMTPMGPAAMRNLLISTGTPQVFGAAGQIGPRPNCRAAIQGMPQPQDDGEWGDAPEQALAYPSSGIIGQFPTCSAVGPPGSFVWHAPHPPFLAYFGPAEDYEPDGNAGNCPLFPPYDADECFMDGDAGLIWPPAYTISGANFIPCAAVSAPLGQTCTMASWGANIDIDVTNQWSGMAYVNVLMDWNVDGMWLGASTCPGIGTAPEHVLVDFPIPPGYSGPLSHLAPPAFLLGPHGSYVWTRFTISDLPVGNEWDGSGSFEIGETEDYALVVVEDLIFEGDLGDAPEGALAYPSSGQNGMFPTCFTGGPAGYVIHLPNDIFPAHFGNMLDYESEGNSGSCPLFPPYDADECQNDGDAGLLLPPAYTIQGGTVVPCSGAGGSLGNACLAATWGVDIDIALSNPSPYDAIVNVLADWNQDGRWQGRSQCPAGAAPEHLLVNFTIPAGFTGALSALAPPAFMIGPRGGYVWVRFTLSSATVPFDWNGAWVFDGGESEDYLLHVGQTSQQGEYGDAPEGSLAYPWLGVNGAFPTCRASGPAGFVYHQPLGWALFGPSVDFEIEGNAGNCPLFPPYDADECFLDGDAGLMLPPAYTLDASLSVVPCDPTQTGPLGTVCAPANWGANVDIWVTNNMPVDGFVNVLMDWNQDGQWQGQAQCPGIPAPEHVLVNFGVPLGYSGPLSALGPPGFLIGPIPDYIWTRFTVSETPVPNDWDGSGSFEDGETCDFLLLVYDEQPEEGEFGDAPEGAIAYPSLGIIGMFPTCTGVGPAGAVYHLPRGTLFFGPMADFEADGNAGNCPLFPPYDADECFIDADAGLLVPPAYTIDNLMNVVPCAGGMGPLGGVCRTALWGINIDIQAANVTSGNAYVNLLIDWDGDGQWGGAAQCPSAAAPEHVLVNFVVPPGFNGPLAALGPPAFLIGPRGGYAWSRFTISEQPVVNDWNGAAVFDNGETEDYLLLVVEEQQEYGDAPEGAVAYPDAGIVGWFPTCIGCGPAGFVSHGQSYNLFLGPQLDFEPDGNAGNCIIFPPYDADECYNDPDAGLLFPPAYTIDNSLNVVPCDTTATGCLGYACTTAQWGAQLDLMVANVTNADALVNVLMDWNRDGHWQGQAQCPSAVAPEHVLINFVVPAGFVGPLSGLAPPPFLIGPEIGMIWTRFTISERAVPVDWNGEDAFEIGETEDYMICVDEEPPSGACCFPEAECLLLTAAACNAMGGDYQGDGTTCTPNPCPYDAERVCCVGDDCVLVLSELACANLGGQFYPEYLTCQPNPCTTCIHWATHNVGNCELTVTDQGILGFMDDTQAEGDGFIYPAGGGNLLFVGSLWIGADSSYVANRDYSADPDIEWAYSQIPLGCVWIDLNGHSHQDIHAAYRDDGGVGPALNLLVWQDSWAWSYPDPADDLVIIRYVVQNDGDDALYDLYGGLFCDFDIEAYDQNEGAVVSNHGLVYVTDNAGLWTGIVQLSRGTLPIPQANLTLVHNPTFVYPNNHVPDADKIAFLSAADSAHVMTASPEPGDYSALASAGPFDLAGGASDTLAFAVVGGLSLAEVEQNARVARLIYQRGWAGIDEPPPGEIMQTRLLPASPNPFGAATVVRFDLHARQSVTLGVYDISGRLVRTLLRGTRDGGRYNVVWAGRGASGQRLPGGVYFVRLQSDAGEESRPIIVLR